MFAKHRHIPRLYVQPITEKFTVSDAQSRHLVNVFRLTTGSNFIAFNPNDGEWECEIISITKKQVVAKRIIRTRTCSYASKLYIAFGIIKPDNMRLIVEKCTELGTTEFFPLITEYTQYRNINISKFQAIAIQASEQSERIDVPVIHEPVLLPVFVEKLPPDVIWLSALERSGKAIYRHHSDNVGFIIGSEGGFSDAERLLLAKKTEPISLGNNILRTETACIACACLATCCMNTS